jgi:hypothetical protein
MSRRSITVIFMLVEGILVMLTIGVHPLVAAHHLGPMSLGLALLYVPAMFLARSKARDGNPS